MCGGVRNQSGESPTAIAARQAIERQREMERIAREREAMAAQQQAQLVAMQQQQAQQEIAQQTRVSELQTAQQERLGGIRARGQAVTQSLQILAQSSGQGPTAAMTNPKAAQSGARSTTASLRMGSLGRASGSGANLAV